jgi:hypothetical protein
MARLEVSATIHPLDVSYVLVAVEDEAGEPVEKLGPDDLTVAFWASGGFAPGMGGAIPVAAVDDWGSPKHGLFYTLRLGEVIYGGGTPDDPYSPTPVATFHPLVYSVSVDRDGDHGQAIACACCSPAEESYWTRRR